MQIPWTARETNQWVLDQIKPEISLETEMLILGLSYFVHIKRRQDSLEKTIMLGEVEGSRKRGRPHKRWTDPLKEATYTTMIVLGTALSLDPSFLPFSPSRHSGEQL